MPAIAALASLAFILAACGGDDVTSPPATPPAAQAPVGTTATLALLETTDLHTNVLSYDYFKLAADNSLGFERVSTLIAQARAQYPNTLLLDNGDTIQGTALSDYQAAREAGRLRPDARDLQGDERGEIRRRRDRQSRIQLRAAVPVAGDRQHVRGRRLPAPAQQKKCAGPNFRRCSRT